MKSLHQKQLLFVQSLASGTTIKKAAQIAKVTEPSVSGWLKKPEIQSALAEARAAIQRGRVKVMETVSAENTQAIFPRVSHKLELATEDAVDFLVNLVRDQDARKADRLKASLEILRIAGFPPERNTAQMQDPVASINSRRGLSPKTSSEIRRQILGLPLETEDDLSPLQECP